MEPQDRRMAGGLADPHPNHALRIRRTSVEEEKQLIADMEPQQRLARPLLVVVPENYPTAHEECDHAKQ
ncbi:hypothetical protein JCM18918_755 [Cutibacterium acnes JCM 18918]|nr:hypothetical protein JCM18918_755 [Cutibacterium acnes JCM 18918]